jgi:hypothetical protein
MSCIIEKDVFWLEIAIHDIQIVQVFECKKEFCVIEVTAFIIELLFTLEMVE